MIRFIALLCTVAMLGCQSCNPQYQQDADDPKYLHAGVQRLTEIILHDIFSPPVASRIYAYSVVAGYEAMQAGYPEYQSLSGSLNGLSKPPQPEAGATYCFPLAGINAMLIVGKTLVFSEENVETLEEEILQDFQALNMPPDVYKRSLEYGRAVAEHIVAWSKTDRYAETRSLPKFTIDTKTPGRWRPTPPAYEDALEPYWGTIRTWVLRSPTEVSSDPPAPFSTQKGSEFYAQATATYEAVRNLNDEQIAIAWYWDDNPFASVQFGHLMSSRKKISPGGHWMSITGTACRKAGKNAIESAQAYVLAAVSLADAFIACWDEKYRTNLIRPETYINEHIDPEWTPLIQTPPFPEHTSGHSTISASAASALTLFFGDNFAFTDSTEVVFGMEARTFPSFMAAAEEVAMSRLYGGIHYPRGNEAGAKCGREIGRLVSERLRFKP